MSTSAPLQRCFEIYFSPHCPIPCDFLFDTMVRFSCADLIKLVSANPVWQSQSWICVSCAHLRQAPSPAFQPCGNPPTPRNFTFIYHHFPAFTPSLKWCRLRSGGREGGTLFSARCRSFTEVISTWCVKPLLMLNNYLLCSAEEVFFF